MQFEIPMDGKGKPAVITRLVDNDLEYETGFTEADRIVQEFIIILVKDVIDLQIIEGWTNLRLSLKHSDRQKIAFDHWWRR